MVKSPTPLSWLSNPARATPEAFDAYRKRTRSTPLTATFDTVLPGIKNVRGEIIIPANKELAKTYLDALHNDPDTFRVRGDYVRLYMPAAKAFLLPIISEANGWGLDQIALKQSLGRLSDDTEKKSLNDKIAEHEKKDPLSLDALNGFIDLLKKELPQEIKASLAETEAMNKRTIALLESAKNADHDEIARLKRRLDQDLANHKNYADTYQIKNFDIECQKAKKVLEAAAAGKLANGGSGGLNFGDKGQRPDLRAGESQLLWSAVFTYLHAHGHLASDSRLSRLGGGNLEQAYRESFETHPIIESVQSDAMLKNMLNSCSEAARSADRKLNNGKIYWGAPGSDYYHVPGENYINLDLVKTLALGVTPGIGSDKQRRFYAVAEPILIHEIGHELYSKEYPKQMREIWEELKKLGPKVGYSVGDNGSMRPASLAPEKIDEEDSIKFQVLYKEWQTLHHLWNVMEDHAVNQHAVRLRIDEERESRYPIDTPRLLQLSWGLFADINDKLKKYHLHNRGEKVGDEPEEALQALIDAIPRAGGPTDEGNPADKKPASTAQERFGALCNAGLYSYYTDTLHLLPPGKPALRAFGVKEGILDAGSYTEDKVLEKMTEASRILQLDGLPSAKDERKAHWLNLKENKGATYDHHVEGVRQLVNERRNEAIQSIFDIANEIALPELRKEWEKQARLGELMKKLGGAAPSEKPGQGPARRKPGGKGTDIGSGADDHANKGQDVNDVPSPGEQGKDAPAPGKEGNQSTPAKPQTAPKGGPHIMQGDIASTLGRETLDKLAESKEYSTYSQLPWYSEAVDDVAKKLKETLEKHWHHIKAYASEHPGQHQPHMRNVPGKRITENDGQRYAISQAELEAGQLGSHETFEWEKDLPSPMTHHIILLVDGSGSMGSPASAVAGNDENAGAESRQKIAAKLAALMQDAAKKVNDELSQSNSGIPLLTCTTIEWGDAKPNLVISSALENSYTWGETPSKRKEKRDNALDILTEGKGCGGTEFSPAPAAGFDHLRSKEMMDFQSGDVQGPRYPTVASVSTIILSDGGIHDPDASAKVLASMGVHPNAGTHLLLLGRDSDALSDALTHAYDEEKAGGAALKGRPIIYEWGKNDQEGFANGMLDIIEQGIMETPAVAPLEPEEHEQYLTNALAEMEQRTGKKYTTPTHFRVTTSKRSLS